MQESQMKHQISLFSVMHLIYLGLKINGISMCWILVAAFAKQNMRTIKTLNYTSAVLVD